jgi:hypothetical protein
VHGTGVYYAGVGPKGPALERFPDIKKKKKKNIIPSKILEDSQFHLHMHHQSTIMTNHFLTLFVVRFFSRAANQAKKAALKYTLVHRILFQGKGMPSVQANPVKGANIEPPFF